MTNNQMIKIGNIVATAVTQSLLEAGIVKSSGAAKTKSSPKVKTSPKVTRRGKRKQAKPANQRRRRQAKPEAAFSQEATELSLETLETIPLSAIEKAAKSNAARQRRDKSFTAGTAVAEALGLRAPSHGRAVLCHYYPKQFALPKYASSGAGNDFFANVEEILNKRRDR
jgi:hypothetical protein